MKIYILLLTTLFFFTLKSQLRYQMDTAHAKVGDYVYYHPLDCRTPYVRVTDALLLDSFVLIIKKYPNYLFSIEEHTDCRLDSLYNRQLSQRFCDSFRVYMLIRGADSSRLIAIGKGEDELAVTKCKCDKSDIYNICTEWEHHLNRRIMLRIIRKREDQ